MKNAPPVYSALLRPTGKIRAGHYWPGPKWGQLYGTLHTTFVTEPLWGVGSTAAYGHDGRSMDLTDIILRHGGEADASRRAFQRLSVFDQRLVLDFLRSLILFPPDDTASNLNPGHPGTTNPQNPAEHGSINLGALFQIPSEGAE